MRIQNPTALIVALKGRQSSGLVLFSGRSLQIHMNGFIKMKTDVKQLLKYLMILWFSISLVSAFFDILHYARLPIGEEFYVSILRLLVYAMLIYAIYWEGLKR